MVEVGRNLGAILANRKSTQDFMLEEELLNKQKRQDAMKEELAGYELEKARRELSAPQLPFRGDGFDAQVGNIAYEKFYKETGNADLARQMAADAVLRTKITTKVVEGPGGELITVAEPRPPLFGGAPNAPSYPMGTKAEFPENMPNYSENIEEIPLDGPTYVDGFEVDAMPMPAAGQDISPRPLSLSDLEKVMSNRDAVLQMPAAQGAAVDRGVSPQDLTQNIPAASRKTRQLAQEEALKLEAKQKDPEFLLKQKEELEKKSRAESYKNQKRQVAVDDTLQAINILKNEKSLLPKTGAIGQIVALEGSTAAGQLQALIQSIQSQNALEAVQTGRENSPTGGFLGTTSDKDIELVKNSFGNLSLNQRPEYLERALQRVYNAQMDAIHGTPEQIAIIGKKIRLPQEEIEKLSYRFPIQDLSPSNVLSNQNNTQSGWSIKKVGD